MSELALQPGPDRPMQGRFRWLHVQLFERVVILSANEPVTKHMFEDVNEVGVNTLG